MSSLLISTWHNESSCTTAPRCFNHHKHDMASPNVITPQCFNHHSEINAPSIPSYFTDNIKHQLFLLYIDYTQAVKLTHFYWCSVCYNSSCLWMLHRNPEHEPQAHQHAGGRWSLVFVGLIVVMSSSSASFSALLPRIQTCNSWTWVAAPTSLHRLWQRCWNPAAGRLLALFPSVIWFYGEAPLGSALMIVMFLFFSTV